MKEESIDSVVADWLEKGNRPTMQPREESIDSVVSDWLEKKRSSSDLKQYRF